MWNCRLGQLTEELFFAMKHPDRVTQSTVRGQVVILQVFRKSSNLHSLANLDFRVRITIVAMPYAPYCRAYMQCDVRAPVERIGKLTIP